MAIRYSLLGQGKRFRGLLVLASYHAAGGLGDASGLAGCAVQYPEIAIVPFGYGNGHAITFGSDSGELERENPVANRH